MELSVKNLPEHGYYLDKSHEFYSTIWVKVYIPGNPVIFLKADNLNTDWITVDYLPYYYDENKNKMLEYDIVEIRAIKEISYN